jgi:hypothetical protein
MICQWGTGKKKTKLNFSLGKFFFFVRKDVVTSTKTLSMPTAMLRHVRYSNVSLAQFNQNCHLNDTVRSTLQVRMSFPAARTFITVVQQAEVAFRETLGANRTRLEPGLQWRIPIYHKLWKVSQLHTSSIRIVTVSQVVCFSCHSCTRLICGSTVCQSRTWQLIPRCIVR